jgi:hypothetical protein
VKIKLKGSLLLNTCFSQMRPSAHYSAHIAALNDTSAGPLLLLQKRGSLGSGNDSACEAGTRGDRSAQ